MKLVPTYNNVLLMRIPDDELNNSVGIIIPGAKNDVKIYEVIAVGPETKFALKIGGKVVVQKFAGTEIKIEDETYTLIPDIAILAELE